jgi:hypothetical protein
MCGSEFESCCCLKESWILEIIMGTGNKELLFDKANKFKIFFE